MGTMGLPTHVYKKYPKNPITTIDEHFILLFLVRVFKNQM